MIFIKSITLENNEVILINGKLFLATENFLAQDGDYNLENLESIIDEDLKAKILRKESNGMPLNVQIFNLKYASKLKG